MKLVLYSICFALVFGICSSASASKSPPPIPIQSPHAVQKQEQLRRQFAKASLAYLEGVNHDGDRYIRPSEIDARFTIALYVNTAGSGSQAQRLWFLQRDELGGPWRLGLWDQKYWRARGLPDDVTPPYNWPVSTGRKYPGDRFSGPTPTGVFALDERKGRMIRGYGAPGMINVAFIDFHYRSGRRSGVAFHGTTGGKYRLLGSIDSHGCIRMTKTNALAMLNRLQGRDGVITDELRWGHVPRFWSHERHGQRFGYTRDGSPHYLPTASAREVPGAAVADTADDQFPSVLTKEGYRAIAVLFKD